MLADRQANTQTDRHAHHNTPPPHGDGDGVKSKGKGSPYSFAERRVPELISVHVSQPAGDVET